MTRTSEEYEKEIEDLKRMLELMRQEQQLAMKQCAVSRLPVNSSSFTIVGIEELVMQLAPDFTITYANSTLVALLGKCDKREVVGQKATDEALMGFNQAFIKAIVSSAQSTGQTFVTEQHCPELARINPDIRNPAGSGPLLRFAVTPLKKGTQIIIQDVTRIRWLESTFGKYVPLAVIQRMAEMPDHDFMRTERVNLTVLFADLRGFTALSQELEPEAIREMVNEYFTEMAGCIEANEGMIDKFVGDEIMAVFGAPIPSDNHALMALVTAAEMQQRQSGLIQRRQARGQATLPMGIGIATGRTILGNIGTPTRVDYTVLGHTVNLAARLCAQAGPGEILTVKGTHHDASRASGDLRHKAIPKMQFTLKGEIAFKNVREPVEVYAVTVC